MAKKPPQERMRIRKEKTLPALKNTIWSKSDSNGIQPDRDRKSEQAGSIQIPCLYFFEKLSQDEDYDLEQLMPWTESVADACKAAVCE